MAEKSLNDNGPMAVVVISQVIIIAFLIVDINVLFNKDSIAAKSLAAVAFVGFMFLLISSIIAIIKRKR